MNKQIEKIREAVSSLIVPESKCEGMLLTDIGRQYAYREVIDIIDSMQEEPVSNDLEEEIICYIGYPEEVDEDVSTTMIRKAARHFADWQKKMALDNIVNWLQKHADNYTWYNEFEGESGMTDDFIDELKKAIQ